MSSDDRLYALLALFDRRDGSTLARLVQAAREGYERSDPEMGAADNEQAWDEFDRLWGLYTAEQRQGLAFFEAVA